MRILAVSGSLRRDSHNSRLLRVAQQVVPAGAGLELWDGLRDLPPYDQDLEAVEAPGPVARLREDWSAADAILFATPEYNGSIPGVLKNAVDWASRPKLEAALRNKTVAVVGASEGQFGALWAQIDLRRVLGVAGARVVGEEMPIARVHEKLDAEGRLRDEDVRERLRQTLELLVAAAAPESLAA